MRNYTVVTIHPNMIRSYCQRGVLRAAEDKKLAMIEAVDLRDYAIDQHGSIDDRPYGGGEGMVLRPEPLASAVKAITQKLPHRPRILLTSPQGKRWDQKAAEAFANNLDPLIFICGRFGGIDQRFIDSWVDEEWSIGDVILAGGELPALIMMESILRLIPGVLGDHESAHQDSFGERFEGRLEYPLYTRPREWDGKLVPEVLQSGNHQKIEEWKKSQSKLVTSIKRPDLATSILLKNS